MRPFMRLAPVWIVCLLLAACARDPIDTPGTWKVPPKGLTSNDENLRAMLVSPGDLTHGTGETTSIGITAATAARRELTGRRAPLPNANASAASPTAGNQQGQQGQSPAGALGAARAE
jgi:hypothetical protein